MSLTANAADSKTGHDPLQTRAGGSENVCVRTSLSCSGGHQLPQPPLSAAAVVAVPHN